MLEIINVIWKNVLSHRYRGLSHQSYDTVTLGIGSVVAQYFMVGRHEDLVHLMSTKKKGKGEGKEEIRSMGLYLSFKSMSL